MPSYFQSIQNIDISSYLQSLTSKITVYNIFGPAKCKIFRQFRMHESGKYSFEHLALLTNAVCEHKLIAIRSVENKSK